ncbi:glycoside hydrolase superfamily [Obelidium mucronatum]|nr:glycoside hydrolase superfamily [Obelidium mucronatum]
MQWSQLLVALFALATTSTVVAKVQIPKGKYVFGVWFDGTSGKVSGNDTAARITDRLGFNPGSYQIWQHMPPKVEDSEFLPLLKADGTPNIEEMFNEGTDASIFLTIYPSNLNVTDAEITLTANGVRKMIDTSGRNVLIRLAPEMNGDWFIYGKRPAEFVAFWKRVFAIFRTITPEAEFVWAPNFDGPASNTPYDPFWPGPDYVDWVGISLYWKGFNADWPWRVNKAAPSDYVAQIIDATGPEGGRVSFYKEYAVKYNKPLVIAECAAAWNQALEDSTTKAVTPLPVGPGHVNLTMSFWNSFAFNPDFIKAYPLFKMVFAFEIYKVEDGVQREFRALVEPTLGPMELGMRKMDDLGLISWAKKVGTVEPVVNVTGTAAVVTKKAGGASTTVSLTLLTVCVVLAMIV